MKTAYWIITTLFCLMMLLSAAVEIFAFAQSVAMLEQLGYPVHLAYVLPVTKILGVAAILTKYSRTLKEWAYAGFFFDFSLAILAHTFSGVPSPLPAFVALALLAASYALDRRLYGRSTEIDNVSLIN